MRKYLERAERCLLQMQKQFLLGAGRILFLKQFAQLKFAYLLGNLLQLAQRIYIMILVALSTCSVTLHPLRQCPLPISLPLYACCVLFALVQNTQATSVRCFLDLKPKKKLEGSIGTEQCVFICWFLYKTLEAQKVMGIMLMVVVSLRSIGVQWLLWLKKGLILFLLIGISPKEDLGTKFNWKKIPKVYSLYFYFKRNCDQ